MGQNAKKVGQFANQRRCDDLRILNLRINPSATIRETYFARKDNTRKDDIRLAKRLAIGAKIKIRSSWGQKSI